MTPHEKTLVFIPTYNERDNVERLYREIRALGLDVDYLLIDDASPDGTGEIIDRLAEDDPAVAVVHRPGKLGVGGAHLDGISWAYEHGYRRLVTMDCDFTHSLAYLKDFIREGAGHDVVVGSRYAAPGSLAGWSLYRRTATRAGHLLTSLLLDLPYDATGGYRHYRLDRIPPSVFSRVRSRQYAFFFESLHILHREGFSIAEIPIALPSRTRGASKMTALQMLRVAGRVLSVAWAQSFGPERGAE